MATNHTSRRSIVAAAAAFVLVSSAGAAFAALPLAEGVGNDKPHICHATDSDTNPYVLPPPAQSGDLEGHADHTGPLWSPGLKDAHIKWGDIIPPFDYVDGQGQPAHFPGLNWVTGQATYDNDCQFVPPALGLQVVKTNDANGNEAFTDEETAASAGQAVTFQVVVTNTGDAPVEIDSVVDTVGGNPVALDCSSLVGLVLEVGESVTCTATVTGYAPAAGDSKVNTVTVGGHQSGDCPSSDRAELRRRISMASAVVQPKCDLGDDPDNTVQASDTSRVNTPGAPTPTPTITVSPTPSETPSETPSPTPSETPSETPSATPSETVSPTPSESTGGGGTVQPGESPSPTQSPFTGGGGTVDLPFTGLPATMLVSIAAGMLALGSWLLLVGRRRTTS